MENIVVFLSLKVSSFDNSCIRYPHVTFVENPQLKIIGFQNYIYSSYKLLRVWLHDGESLEITLTTSLSFWQPYFGLNLKSFFIKGFPNYLCTSFKKTVFCLCLNVLLINR